MAMNPNSVEAAIAEINAEIARGNLQLNRDIYQNINLPMYRNVTFPNSYAGLTGYLPSEYPGVFHDQPTFGSMMDTAQMFGRAGTDARFANLGYKPGERTLGGQQLDEQRRQFDTAQGQDYALETGLPSTIGMGQRLLDARQALLANPQYQAAQQAGDQGTLRRMEQAVWAQGSGLPPELVAQASERARELIHASGGQLPQAQALEQAIQEAQAQQQRGGAGGDGGGVAGGGAAGYGPGPISQAQRALMENARQFNTRTALDALQLQSQLRTDPFALEQFRRGLGATGIPNSIAAVAGTGVLPGVQAPTGPMPGQASLQGAVNQLTGAGQGGAPYGGLQQAPAGGMIRTAQGQPTFGTPGGTGMRLPGGDAGGGYYAQQGGMAGAQQQLGALPRLNQVNARNYMRLDPSGQRYVNSAFRASGQAADDDDVYEAVRRGLPQFARRGVPTFGRVS